MISSTVLVLKFALLGTMYLFVLLIVVLIVADLRRSGRAAAAPGAAEPRYYLAVIGGEGESLGRRFLLADQNVIGRDPDNDITLDDPSVSGRHARLRLEPEGYVVEDLGSTNGTLLNGAQIVGPTAVRPGDKLKLGRMILVLEV